MAFDALLAIPALLTGLNISMFREFIAIKCIEVCLINGLRREPHIDGNREWMRCTDRGTVEALQLKVPGLCAENSKVLSNLLREGKIFLGIRNQSQQQAIWENLSKINTSIPSVYSLFEDIKYLRPHAKIMKCLLGKSFKSSIRRSMEDSFSGVNQSEGRILIQETEECLKPYTGSLADQIDLGIFQLWLYSGQHCMGMIDEHPRKEDGHPKPAPMKGGRIYLVRFCYPSVCTRI